MSERKLDPRIEAILDARRNNKYDSAMQVRSESRNAKNAIIVPFVQPTPRSVKDPSGDRTVRLSAEVYNEMNRRASSLGESRDAFIRKLLGMAPRQGRK